ncbi:MAG: glycosyltransferase [Pseudothermotoga sp.]
MLYISTPEDLFKSPGVLKKIQSQVSALSILLKDKVLLICVKGGKVLLESYNDHNGVVLASFKGFRSTFDKLSYYRFILENWNTIKENHGVQLAYIRLTWYDNYLLKIISQLKFDGFSVLVEIPTSNFRYEYFKSGIKGWYKILNFLIYGPRILSLADVIVSIGSFSPVLRGMESKTLVITNGIGKDVLKKPLVHSPQKSEAFNLIGVANVSFWHGFDRVIKGLANYYKKGPEKKVYFHVVGDGPALPRVKTLVEKSGVEEYIIFHGVKTGRDLDELFNICHVAVGSLGMHRIRLKTGSILKSREYCARGIPFIIGYEDPDFPQIFKYVFRVPADETPVDIESVVAFYDRIKNENYALEMRKYAEEHLVWSVKLKPVVETIRKLSQDKKEDSRVWTR